MNTLHVLYDERCAFCLRCRDWLQQQPAFLELEFIPRSAPEITERFPGIEEIDAADELVVISDTGALYQGANALVMCLWALREYREWSQRLASPMLLPLSRAAFDLISTNRLSISRLLGMSDEREVAEAINGAGQTKVPPVEVCTPPLAPAPAPVEPAPAPSEPAPRPSELERSPPPPPPLPLPSPDQTSPPAPGYVTTPQLALSAATAIWTDIEAADATPQTITVSNSGSGALDWRIDDCPWWLSAERRGVELILTVKHCGTHGRGEVRIVSTGGTATILVEAAVHPDAEDKLSAVRRAVFAAATATLAATIAWLMVPAGFLEPIAFSAAFAAVWAQAFSGKQWVARNALAGALAGLSQCLLAALPLFVSSMTLRNLGPVAAVVIVTAIDAGRGALWGWVWGQTAGDRWLARRAAMAGLWVCIPALAINAVIAFSGKTRFATSGTQTLLALVILGPVIFSMVGAAISPLVKRTRPSFAKAAATKRAPVRRPPPPPKPPAVPEPDLDDEDDEPSLFPVRIGMLIKFAILAALLASIALVISHRYYDFQAYRAEEEGGGGTFRPPAVKLPALSAKAQALLEELRLIDAAVDQWGIETSKPAGTVPKPKEIAAYVKRGTRLHATLENGECEDLLGNPLKLPPLGAPPSLSRQSADQLSKYVPADFWKPFPIE